MPYGLSGFGLGDCTNVSNGVGVDSASGEPCVIGTPTVVAVPPSGPASYGQVINGQVYPIYVQSLPTSGQSFSQWMSANGLYVGLGLGAFFLFMMAGGRR